MVVMAVVEREVSRVVSRAGAWAGARAVVERVVVSEVSRAAETVVGREGHLAPWEVVVTVGAARVEATVVVATAAAGVAEVMVPRKQSIEALVRQCRKPPFRWQLIAQLSWPRSAYSL